MKIQYNPRNAWLRLTLVLVIICHTSIFAQKQSIPQLLHPNLTNTYYQLHPGDSLWFNANPESARLRNTLISLIDSCRQSGLTKSKYHASLLQSLNQPTDSVSTARYNRLHTDALIAFSLDLFQGASIAQYLKNDEVSVAYKVPTNDYLFAHIGTIKSANDLTAFIRSLEPNTKEYQLLKNELISNLALGNKMRTSQLIACLNLYRYVHHFHADKYIVVNIPSATLRYYEGDSLKLVSKVVVGKIATRSPRMSTWCHQIVLYPYWNVPRGLGLKELLPHYKRDPSAMGRANMQLVAANGRVVDQTGINWSQYNSTNFPYRFRQCTGCENSLGVIKFNLTDPFNVYLHDTNYKLAFLKDIRFLSHGCIRVEKPLELGNMLAGNSIDSNFLKACYKDQLPKEINLPKKVPVFIVYMPAEAMGDSVTYYKDVYRLFR